MKKIILYITVFNITAKFNYMNCAKRKTEGEYKEQTLKRIKHDSKIATRTLWEAIKKGDFDRAQKCIQNNADVNARNIYLNNTPIIYATKRNKKDIVRLLLDNNADVNISDGFGYTALFWTIIGSHIDPEIFKMLLENGAEVNITDKIFEETPLIMAAQSNQIEKVKMLLNYGANVNMRNNQGQTFLTIIENGKYKELKKVYDEYIEYKEKVATEVELTIPLLPRDLTSLLSQYLPIE